MIALANKDQMRGLEEVAVNICKNTLNEPLSKQEEDVCRRWRKSLKLIALKRYPVAKKKQILQRGGFLGAILPVLASVLGSLLNG